MESAACVMSSRHLQLLFIGWAHEASECLEQGRPGFMLMMIAARPPKAPENVIFEVAAL